MDTARSFTSKSAMGSVDSESAQGGAMPIVRAARPQTRRSPPMLSSRPCTPRPGSSAAEHARSTIYPLAMALRLSGLSESRWTECSPGVLRQAGWARRDLAAASSESSGIRPLAAARDQRRVNTSTLGSKAPPLRFLQASQAVSTSQSSDERLIGAPAAACHRLNSLARS